MVSVFGAIIDNCDLDLDVGPEVVGVGRETVGLGLEAVGVGNLEIPTDIVNGRGIL